LIKQEVSYFCTNILKINFVRMAQIDLVMPKMGESIMEATILKWVKNVGDSVEADETILEIATDKVDSEVPSPVSGVISQIMFEVDDVVEIGKVIAIIATEGEAITNTQAPAVVPETASNGHNVSEQVPVVNQPTPQVSNVAAPVVNSPVSQPASGGGRFYSPLVKNIALKENISLQELDTIPGSGLNGRLTKNDMLSYINNRQTNGSSPMVQPTTVQNPVVQQSIQKPVTQSPPVAQPKQEEKSTPQTSNSYSTDGNVEIVEMDRMRKLIADHMVMSKKTSPHVTSFVEVDVTDIVEWRNSVKVGFQKKYGEKITFTPIFIEAVVKALNDFPMVNVSVTDDKKIIVKKDLNIGMAAALPSGNLIVPVIKNADRLNLMGLTKSVNDLANRARHNKLKPEEIQGGTFTVTNVGTFGNVMGTPIINQPQVAILAVGAIRKKPAVLETEFGDVIAVRHLMFLSLAYDHRVVDGFLGGSFLRKIGDYLEAFDKTRSI